MAASMVLRRTTVSPIGLDLGRTGARVVQLTRCDRARTLVAATTWHFGGEDAPADSWPALQERLARAVRHQDVAGRALVAGLSQPDVELHALELPRAKDAPADRQIDSAARWEIQRLCGFEDQAAQTAHWWLPPGRGTCATAIGAAVPEPALKQLWEICRRAGADCRGVDVAACALSRAGTLLRPPAPDQVWGILDLGARGTRLILCVDEVPVLARSLDSGGQLWTRKIAASLQVSPEAAERHKCDHGIRPGGWRPSSAAGVRPADEPDNALVELAGLILGALRPELDRIADEVERSYEYVLQSYPERKAADLILAGGGAACKQLDHYLAERLGIPVASPDGYLGTGNSRLSIDPSLGKIREPIAAYLAAIGLAVEPEDQA